MALPSPVKKAATYEDLLDVPEHRVAEILAGELYSSPRPSPRHSQTAIRLGGALVGPFDQGQGGPGGWLILIEPELHLHDDVIVPDFAAWRRERLSAPPETAHISTAPDWVCEILSPSTEHVDRVRKLQIYARETVGFVWLLNPLQRTLEILKLEQGRWIVLATHGDEDTAISAEPFGAVPLELSRVWPG